jgi:hypothetical protein
MEDVQALQNSCYDIKYCVRYPDKREPLQDHIRTFGEEFRKVGELSACESKLDKLRSLAEDWNGILPDLLTLCPQPEDGQQAAFDPPVNNRVAGSGGISHHTGYSYSPESLHPDRQSSHAMTAVSSQSVRSRMDGVASAAPAFATDEEVDWYSEKLMSIVTGVGLILVSFGQRRGWSLSHSHRQLSRRLDRLQVALAVLHGSLAKNCASSSWTTNMAATQAIMTKIDPSIREQAEGGLTQKWRDICSTWRDIKAGYPDSRVGRGEIEHDNQSLCPTSNVTAKTGSRQTSAQHSPGPTGSFHRFPGNAQTLHSARSAQTFNRAPFSHAPPSVELAGASTSLPGTEASLSADMNGGQLVEFLNGWADGPHR